MGFGTSYLVDIPGHEFNDLLEEQERAGSDFLLEVSDSSNGVDFWETTLPGDDLVFMVDVSGLWTFCQLPYPYAAIARKRTVQDQALDWEMKLRRLVGDVEAYRVDGFVFDEWNSQYDYLLVRDDALVRMCLECIGKIEPGTLIRKVSTWRE